VLDVDGTNPFAKLGAFMTLLYIFGVFGLIEELSIMFVGVKPYLTSWSGIVALMAAIFTGGLSRVFSFKPAGLMLGFAAWMVICMPFSTWRGGSLEAVTQYLMKSAIVTVLVLMTTTNWSQLRRMIYAMGGVAVLISLAVRSSIGSVAASDPRLAFGEGRLANPNDLATHMLVLLPFSIGMFFLAGRMSLLRPAALLVSGATLFTILRTGSRGALVTMILMGVILFIKMPNPVHKLALAVTAFLSFAAVLSVLPAETLRRYQLIFSSEETLPENVMEAHALDSSEARRIILRRSIELTLTHPILGVGPGAFQMAEAVEAQDEGRRGAWLQTHNAYTQVSSEMGFPGLLLFVGAILTALKSSWRYNRVLREIGLEKEALIMMVLFFAIAAFAVNIIFSSLAYSFYIPSLVGLLGSAVMLANRDIARHQGALRAAAPATPAAPAWPFAPRPVR
jgi:O-antigen ligase